MTPILFSLLKGLQETLDKSSLFQSKTRLSQWDHKNQEKQRHRFNPMHLIIAYKFRGRVNLSTKKH